MCSQVILYNHSLILQAMEFLCTKWNSEPFIDYHKDVLDPVTKASNFRSDVITNMVLVELPEELQISDRSATSANGKHIQDTLFNKYNIECPVKCLGTLHL